MKCRKHSCRNEAAQFFSVNGGRNLVALCAACGHEWVESQRPHFKPVVLTREEFDALDVVQGVMGS